MAITGSVKALIQANNGDVLAGSGSSARIYRSTDNGQNFSLVIALGSASDSVNAFARVNSSGYLLAAVSGSATASGIWRSTDHGATWTKVKTHPDTTGYLDITAIQSGSRLVAVGLPTSSSLNSPVIYSSNQGSTWQEVSLSYFNQTHLSVAAYSDGVLFTQYPGEAYGNVYAFYGTDTYYTAQGGVRSASPATAAGFSTVGGGAGNGGLDMVSFLIKDGTGQYRRRALWAVKSHLDVTDTEVWQWPASPTGPYSFAKITTIDANLFNVMYVDPAFVYTSIGAERTIWAGANGKIFVSYNSGLTWSLATDAPTGQIYSFVRTTSGALIAGGASGEIFLFDGGGSEGGGDDDEDPEEPTEAESTSRFLGRSATCDNEVYVSNKFSFSNITHIFYYNGSTYDNLQFEDVPPYLLFGATPAAGRIAYFGSLSNDSNVPGGPFSNLVFDISQIAEDTTFVWEYWNGSAWTTLTVNDTSDQFKLLGVHSIHWKIPAAWATNTVNSITAFWVRARVSAVGSSPVGPIHANRYIYTTNLPYVEIDSVQIKGDIPAAAKIHWYNQAETSGGALGLDADRVLCGLRSVDRGNSFSPYLNISDEQSLFGISAAAGDQATFGDSLAAPTNRALTVSYSSGGDLNIWKDIATFTIDSSIAREYYGYFRVFLRVSKAGANQDWQFRVRAAFGSGGGVSDTKAIYPTGSASWEVLDLGTVVIPAIQSVFTTQCLCDSLTVKVQGRASATSSAVTLYDLILIPTDEWAIDTYAVDPSANSTAKMLGGDFLEVDSVSNPKVAITTYNRNPARQIISRYQSTHNGPAILQANNRQRLWFMVMNYETYWQSLPEVTGSVQVFKRQHYLGPRGKE